VLANIASDGCFILRGIYASVKSRPSGVTHKHGQHTLQRVFALELLFIYTV
jgi:hypothetical protein